ncbi:uncharacterized protein METZ01_LOCUS174834 [marine metagenome]|uniref:Uncharacterized protein n=1 Tax=marine metagenome TaxID=408172 RepID=A0A382C7F0_9ZZZZ
MCKHKTHRLLKLMGDTFDKGAGVA